MIIIIVWMTMALFGSSQSVSFKCDFQTGNWKYLDRVYLCRVQNFVNITTLDATQIDSISGTHLTGYNNDDVDYIQVPIGHIHYFPRDLNKFFKNLRGIDIISTGLKEIHQGDLKDFQKFMELCLWSSNLEIIEESLFEFNPNLESITLSDNKIQHIDPYVFDKLTKLKTLWLNDNTCINMYADNNSTAVQIVIKTAQTQCTNSDYSNLEQKVKILINESENLNLKNLKEKLENLENEIKSSKFPNFFQQQIQDLKAAQAKKEQEEANETTETSTTTTEDPKESETCICKTCSALESKVNDVTESLKDLVALTFNQTVTNKAVSAIEEQMTRINNAIMMINQNNEEQNRRFLSLMNALDNVFSAVH